MNQGCNFEYWECCEQATALSGFMQLAVCCCIKNKENTVIRLVSKQLEHQPKVVTMVMTSIPCLYV